MSHTGPLNWFISFDERKYCISLVFFKSQCRFFILVQRGSERKTDKKGKKLNFKESEEERTEKERQTTQTERQVE